MFKRILLTGLIVSSLKYIQGQSSENVYNCYYKVGVPCPHFSFDSVENFPKKHVTSMDFRGKWLILDFWNISCVSCIFSFPKVSKEQDEFKGNIQFLMVGLQDKGDEVKVLWRRLQKKEKLHMPVVFDSVLITQIIEMRGMPFLVIIDPEGVVRGTTNTLDGIDLHNLSAAARPILPDYCKEAAHRVEYDRHKPYLVNGNGGNDSNFLFRSLISRWGIGDPISHPYYTNFNMSGKVTILGADLKMLYMYAYFGINFFQTKDILYYGKFWPKPLVEVHDSSLFESNLGEPNMSIAKNIFSYSLTVPSVKANKQYLMQIMQSDLYNYFGYRTRFETRKMPCWRLVTIAEGRSRLKEKFSGTDVPIAPKSKGSRYDELNARGISMSAIMSRISSFTSIGDHSESGPIIDETGIEGKIDVRMEFKPNDFNSVVQSLRENGFDLIQGEKDIKVLVITD
jgi:thiol-disulfide isomerase/thioredoxin